MSPFGFGFSESAIHYASSVGDIEKIKSLVGLRADINSRDTRGRTPLHDAGKSGKSDVIKLLAELGADINSKDTSGQTPLHDAARFGKSDVIKLLIELGSDINSKDTSGWIPLHYAARSGKSDVIKLLAELGADINSKDTGGRTPLHDAVMSGKYDAIKLLAELGADINSKDTGGRTPLHYGESDAIKLLAELGADINSKDTGGRTPLHNAASLGKSDAIKLLITLGADINSEDTSGWIPLHYAASSGKSDVIKLLAELGANINSPNHSGRTPLHYGESDAIKLLITLGADINSKDTSGQTPLHDAARCGKSDVIKLLIELGADINSKDKYGYTPLHDAVKSGKSDVIKLLIELGADVNSKDTYGNTSVEYAISNSDSLTQAAIVLLKLAAILPVPISNISNRVELVEPYLDKLLKEATVKITTLQSSLKDETEKSKKHHEELIACKHILTTLNAELETTKNSLTGCMGDLSTSVSQLRDTNTVSENAKRSLETCLEKSTRQTAENSQLENDLRSFRNRPMSSPDVMSYDRLSTEVAHPNLLNKTVTDVITMEDIHVLEFLNGNPLDMVIFDRDTPYFVYTTDVINNFDRSAAFPCKRVGYTGDADMTTELYMGTMLGIQGTYILAADLRDAISMSTRGDRVFRLTDTLYDVPAIAGKLIAENRGGMVSANHCQAGGNGPVKGLKKLEFRTGNESNPLLSDNASFLEDAKVIEANSTVWSSRTLKSDIRSATSAINLPSERYSQLNWTIVWRTPTSHRRRVDESDDMLDNTLDVNLVSLIHSLRPRIPNVSIVHGAPSNSFTDSSFIRSFIGLKNFSLRLSGRKNGFGIRSVVSALGSHSNTLTELYLDRVDSKIPPLDRLSKLETLTLVFDDYNDYRAPLMDLLGPLKNITTLKKLVLRDTDDTESYSGMNLENSLRGLTVGKLELNFKKFTGSTAFTRETSTDVVIGNGTTIPNSVQQQQPPTADRSRDVLQVPSTIPVIGDWTWTSTVPISPPTTVTPPVIGDTQVPFTVPIIPVIDSTTPTVTPPVNAVRALFYPGVPAPVNNRRRRR